MVTSSGGKGVGGDGTRGRDDREANGGFRDKFPGRNMVN